MLKIDTLDEAIIDAVREVPIAEDSPAGIEETTGVAAS